jgi:hypothetical protein
VGTKQNVSSLKEGTSRRLLYQISSIRLIVIPTQAPGLLGKRFLEKAKCEDFYTHFDTAHPNYYKENPDKNKMHVVTLVSPDCIFL